MKPASPSVAVFLHSGDYDRVHQGLSIAAAAVAAERRADVFFFWWALQRLVTGNLDEPDFPGNEAVADRFEARSLPTLRSLIEYLRPSGFCVFYGCTGSMAVIGQPIEKVEASVDQVVGWSSILQLTAGVTDRFYL